MTIKLNPLKKLLVDTQATLEAAGSKMLTVKMTTEISCSAEFGSIRANRAVETVLTYYNERTEGEYLSDHISNSLPLLFALMPFVLPGR